MKTSHEKNVELYNIIALIVICALITIPKVIQINKENNKTLITSEYTEQYRSLDVTDNTLIHTVYNSKGSNPLKQKQFLLLKTILFIL